MYYYSAMRQYYWPVPSIASGALFTHVFTHVRITHTSDSSLIFPKESDGASRHPLSHALRLLASRQLDVMIAVPSEHRRPRFDLRLPRRSTTSTAGLEILPMGPVPKTLLSRDSLFPGTADTHRGF